MKMMHQRFAAALTPGVRAVLILLCPAFQSKRLSRLEL